MKLRSILIVTFVGAFTFQGIAEAASMSTRVRVLESKVAKQDRNIKQSLKTQKVNEAKIKSSLAKMQALEKKVKKMLDQQKLDKKKGPITDKRYAFP